MKVDASAAVDLHRIGPQAARLEALGDVPARLHVERHTQAAIQTLRAAAHDIPSKEAVQGLFNEGSQFIGGFSMYLSRQ